MAGVIDAILTFQEVEQWWKEAGIDVCQCEERPMGNPDPKVNQLYPVSGGIITSVLAGSHREEDEQEAYYKVHVDGLKNCMELFRELEQGTLTHGFFEVNVCEGGCVKGPASDQWQRSSVRAKFNVETHAPHREEAEGIDGHNIAMDKHFYDRRVRDREPGEAELRQVLHAMGKYTGEDELNCGACGYPTCREKARAVYQGKAEIGMCLPHALEQAESMSNIVMDVTPNMILIVGKDLRIRECNKKAQELLDVSRSEALERYIFEFVDEKDIAEVLKTKEPVLRKKTSIPHTGITVLETIVYIEHLESVLVTYQDITREEKAKEQRYQLKVETVEMAQKVIDNQMMVAQEIAGLLGETTAETKVTLSKLRDSILFGDEEETV